MRPISAAAPPFLLIGKPLAEKRYAEVHENLHERKLLFPPGPLVLALENNKVTGSYHFAGGRVEGTLAADERTVNGTWTQPNGISGGFVLVMSTNGQQVEGHRWIGERKNGNTEYPWAGRRIE